MADEVSLREYVDTNFELRDRALRIQQQASEQALLLATRTLEARLSQLNELRAEVTQDRSNFITRIEFDGDAKDTNRRIDQLERFQARLIGIGIMMAIVAGIIGAGAMKLFFS